MNRILHRNHIACLKRIYRWSLVALVMIMPLVGWGQGLEVVNDFDDGYYLISNANTDGGIWYVYSQRQSNKPVFATTDITINNLWYVSKESVANHVQLYNTEGACEKVTQNANNRIYLSHQGDGTNVLTYKTSQNGSSQTNYRMVLLSSRINDAYVMISNKSSTIGTHGYCTGNATNGGAAFRMDAAASNEGFEKKLFPGSCEDDFSSWNFVPQTVSPNVAWPDVVEAETPLQSDGINLNTMLLTTGRFEYTFQGCDGTLWEEQGYIFPNYNTTDCVVSFEFPSSLPDGISIDNRANGSFAVTVDGIFPPNNVSFTVNIKAIKQGKTTIMRALTFSTPHTINNLNDLQGISDLDGYYVITTDINASSGYSTKNSFSGVLEAAIDPDTKMPYRIQNLSVPLFTTLTGTVKNLVLEDVGITGHSGNTGAIACTANGIARIYNVGILSGSVGGTAYTGGLVGLLDDKARVVNCYSYANISGGTDVGGIVGYNNVATASNNLKTMVFGCMFYGEIEADNCTSIAPIYNGTNIVNKDKDSNGNTGVSNYNYFHLEASYVQPEGVTYNCALGAEDRFLQRFEFYRHLLNSHRELAGWWVTGTYSGDDMMKWVLEPSQLDGEMQYPVLKAYKDQSGNVIKYPSVVNIDAANATTQTERNKGGKLGELAVTIRMGEGGAVFGPPTGATITKTDTTLVITDKDPDHFNFNYYKVQLPYYNDVGTKNYNGNRVVTGWKIVNITGGTPGTYYIGEDVTYDEQGNISKMPYNFADRHCTNKDLYGEGGSNRVFNQGAYWDVPYGVTAITIEPYWAKCVYLADAFPDKVYNQEMTTVYDVPNVGGGRIYTNRNSYPIAGQNQRVFTAKGDAIATSNYGLFQNESGSGNRTVYDYAVVLVGNYHFYGDLDADMSKPYTVTSVDLDGDNEPDYSYILRFDSRKAVHPVRVDFINIPGLGMAQKSTGGTGTYNFGIMQPKGWFESTNTSLFRETQFEYDRSDRGEAPYIVQGGVMEQWVSGQNNGAANKTTYFHVGGNVWFKEFHRGTHQDKTLQSKHPPVSVTGGDYDEFYLTGLYTADVTSYPDNAECYINGGRFGIVCGAAMEGIGNANGANNTGNIVWQIQNADINEFYAGGLNAAKPVTGNLYTTISGGYIGMYCGGPKFGDMSSDKTVTTNATGCIFGTFFGAGYGGNSYARQAPRNHNNIINFPHNDSQAGNHSSWNQWLQQYYKQEYSGTYGGVSTQFNYQFLPMSNNIENVARIFVEYVKFSLATTRGVTSNLTDCTITGNFYGGGSLGKVDGDVISVLEGCTVKGNVFGAGYSASQPKVWVEARGFEVQPYYYEELGTYLIGVKYKEDDDYKPIEYEWEYSQTPVTNTETAIDKTNHILYTNVDLSTSNLGSVSGNVELTLKGNTIVGTTLEGGGLKPKTGNVYGGGDESHVTQNSSNQKGNTTVNLQGSVQVLGNVYGGGNNGPVEGDSKVNIQDSTGQ